MTLKRYAQVRVDLTIEKPGFDLDRFVSDLCYYINSASGQDDVCEAVHAEVYDDNNPEELDDNEFIEATLRDQMFWER